MGNYGKEPPYYAVIFISTRTDSEDGYAEMASKMELLAGQQDGFLGFDSVRDKSGKGITISYWRDMEAINRWKLHVEHQHAQRLGREKWYESYRVQVCKLEREYECHNI